MCCLCSRVKKNISRNQVSIAIFLSSNIHQGDEIFSVQFRGMQCAFMTDEFVAKPELQVLIGVIDRLFNNQSGIKFNITWCSFIAMRFQHVLKTKAECYLFTSLFFNNQ